jgi:uncharacterized protein (DUF433 family)
MRSKEIAMERIVTEDCEVDWAQCALVKSIPDKVSGAPVLKATRMPVQAIIDNYDDGLTPIEVAEAFELRLSDVTAILEFVGKQRARSTR